MVFFAFCNPFLPNLKARAQAGLSELSIEGLVEYMNEQIYIVEETYHDEILDYIEKLYINFFPLYNMTADEEGRY